MSTHQVPLSIMSISVTKSSGSFIGPSSPTPSGLLPLSSIDRVFISGFFFESLHVFKHGHNPASVIKLALAKTLVHYYPIAGRLMRPDPAAELQVDCTGEGVWFVEGEAECSLEEVNYLQDHPLLIPKELLLPSAPEGTTGLTLMMQVTTFKCGGFVVAILFEHGITDGLGIAQFTNAIAESARGHDHLTLPPVWLRDTAIPTPPHSPPDAALTFPSFQTKPLSITVPASRIAHFKSEFTSQTGRTCSTFDVLCAALWQCRARAIGFDAKDEIHLSFVASARDFASLPKGYYGNCVQMVAVSAASGLVVGSSVVEVVGLIRDAKERMGEEFERWKDAEFVVDWAKMGSSYESVNVSAWTRLGFEKVDYGSGVPEFVTPVINVDSISSCFFVKAARGEGVRLVTQCVKVEHMAAFKKEMKKLTG